MRFRLADLAVTPNGRPADASPLGKGPRRLSDYEREIAHALIRKGVPKERAIPMARGLLKKAAATGRWGDHGKAGAKTRAGAVASIAQRKDFSNFDPAEPRGPHGRWISAFQNVAARLDAMAHADGGPSRDKMPQLSGVPKPGSKADKMFPGREPGSEVDLTQEFQDWLGKKGVKVTETEVPSSVLKPSQDELNEAKVVGIAKYMQHAPKDSPVFEPIFTTADNHIIDGHHRWAGNEVRNEVEGVPRWMKVRQMQADLPTSLGLANQFMDEYGLPRVGVNDGGATVSKFAKKPAMSLSVYTAKEIDLVRHVRTPEGAAKYHEPIGSPIVDHGGLPNPSTVNLNGKDVSIEAAIKMVGDSYSWPDADQEGAYPEAKASLHEQHSAQIISKAWHEVTGSDAPEDEQYAASCWGQYQNPDLYGIINQTLRTGKTDYGEDDNGEPMEGPSAADLRRYVEVMFAKGGYTTQKPMTVFRALKSNEHAPTDDKGNILPGYHDWSKELKPGTVFTDKGIVSTTAHERFSEGWLMGNSSGVDVGRENPHDVVLEISVPKGTRIVGGDPQFIETMLPPGSRFKIISAQTQHVTDAVNPLDHETASFTYTHVKAELLP